MATTSEEKAGINEIREETGQRAKAPRNQSDDSDSVMGLWILEVAAASFLVGKYWHHWYIGVGAFFGGIILVLMLAAIPYLRVVLALCVSAIWSLFMMGLAAVLFTPLVGYIWGGLSFLGALKFHLKFFKNNHI